MAGRSHHRRKRRMKSLRLERSSRKDQLDETSTCHSRTVFRTNAAFVLPGLAIPRSDSGLPQIGLSATATTCPGFRQTAARTSLRPLCLRGKPSPHPRHSWMERWRRPTTPLSARRSGSERSAVPCARRCTPCRSHLLRPLSTPHIASCNSDDEVHNDNV